MSKLISAALVVAILACLVVAANADAGRPRPECAPPAKPHCKIHWFAYDYDQYGRDQFGNTYVRTCHVPVRGKRRCGPWLLLRDAIPVEHPRRP